MNTDEIIVKRDLAYVKRGDVELRGDLTLPAATCIAHPLLITLPGGAWRQSNRRSHGDWARHLAKQGFAIFTVEYRIANAAKKAFPDALQDVVAAIQFARGNAVYLSIDPERIGILGSSAGAHLAALAALAGENYAETNAVSPKVKALIGVYGIYDLFAHWQADLRTNPSSDGNVTRNLVGAEPFENQHIYFEASPIRHVQYSKNTLPVLLAWGTNDDAVDPAQSESFMRALQQARFDVRAHRLLGATHWWFNQSPDVPRTDSAWFSPRLLAFLKANL